MKEKFTSLSKIIKKNFINNRGTELLNNPELKRIKQEFNLYTNYLNERFSLEKYDNELFIPLEKMDLNNQLKDIVKVEENNHPCFTDVEYIKRKNWIQRQALDFNFGDEIPIIDYLDSENKTWENVTTKIFGKIESNCCKEYVENFKILQKDAGLNNKKIPQLRDISRVLEKKTGFVIAPVAGLLRPRYFLNLLAFRVFASTQFIRPLQDCEHSGEPDILHEILGHTSMLCDENFAEFSQKIGIASLGATVDEIKQLANIYWFTVEYGLVKERDEKSGNMGVKVYGGGITPSIFEIDYALSMKANYFDVDFDKMQTAYYDYVNLSTNYFIAESIEHMKLKFLEYSIRIQNPRIIFDEKWNIAKLD